MNCPHCNIPIAPDRTDRVWSTGSWLCLVMILLIDALACSWAAGFSRIMRQILTDLGCSPDFPLFTKIAMGVPPSAIYVGGFVLGAVLLAKEFYLQTPQNRLCVNMVGFFLIVLCILFCLFSMNMPLMTYRTGGL